MRSRLILSVFGAGLVAMAAMLGAWAQEGGGDAEAPPPGWAGKSAKTPLYTVQDGNKVDPDTLQGWKTWRAMACERCHGPEQEGLVGPSLVNSLKVLTKDQFQTTIMNGRPEKGMPNFGSVATVQKNWEKLYAYLKGRSDGNIAPGHLYPLAGGNTAQSPKANSDTAKSD